MKNMRDSTIRNRKTAGFSLLEIMVAVSILSIAFLGVLRLHSQTLSMAMASKFDIIAPLLAKQKLSELDTAGLSQTVSDAGDFDDRYPGYRWRIDTEMISSEYLGDTPEIRRIDIAVSSGNDTNVFRLRSYRAVFE